MRVLFYMIILMVASACSVGNSYRNELDRAQEELMNAPERALERLTVMDVSEIDDSASMAKWALLYSEALYRNRLVAPSDTIVNIAIDYYSRHYDEAALHRAESLRHDLMAAGDERGVDRTLSAQYLQKVREYTLYKERIVRQRVIYCSVILLLLAGSVIIWLIGRLKIRRAETEALLAEASSLRAIESDNSILRSAVNELFGTRFALIDRLCNTYYESQGTKAEKNAIVSQVKSEIEALRADASTFSSLEKLANTGRNGMVDLLREAMPEIKSDEYALAVYLACGFSNRAIALLLEEKIETIYKRKSRLKAKIATLPKDYSSHLGAIFTDGQKN